MSEFETKGRFPSPLAAIGLGVSVIAAALTLIFAGLVAYVTLYDAPFWDLWQHVDRDNLLKDLFSRNNEHPVVTNRLLFWIDDALFGATSRFVQIVALLTLAAQVVLFAWLAGMAGIRRAFLIVAPFSVVFVFYPLGFENTIWIFQVSMVLAFTCALGAFTCFAAHVKNGSLPALLGSVVFSVVAVLSFANGVLVPTLVVAMALWLKPKSSIPFVPIAIAAWAWQLSAQGAKSTAAFDPSAIVVHFMTQLGAPIGSAASYAPYLGIAANSQQIALLTGVLVAGLAGLALVYIGMRRLRDPAAVAVAGVILFTLGTAGLVALSRYSMGADQALSSRYNINVALLYSALLIALLMMVDQMKPEFRQWITWTSTVLSLPLLLVAITGSVFFTNLTGRYRAGLEGTVALVAGVRDANQIGQLAFDLDMAERETAKFRGNHKWMFAAPIALRVGEGLSKEEKSVSICANASWTISKPDESAGFRRVVGLLSRQSLSVGAKHVLITDATDVVVGYGHIPRRASDLNPFAQQDGAIIDWIGRIRPNTAPPYRAWLADDSSIRCALRQS